MARIWRIRLGALAILLLAGVGFLFLNGKHLNGKHNAAVTGCADLAKACDAYQRHPSNSKEELPRELRELVHPRFGGGSFTPDGERDLIDPWGKPYLLSVSKLEDGTEYPLIWTVDTKGILISQHGVGPKARRHHAFTK
jgi:general secretion pathway protein G